MLWSRIIPLKQVILKFVNTILSTLKNKKNKKRVLKYDKPLNPCIMQEVKRSESTLDKTDQNINICQRQVYLMISKGTFIYKELKFSRNNSSNLAMPWPCCGLCHLTNVIPNVDELEVFWIETGWICLIDDAGVVGVLWSIFVRMFLQPIVGRKTFVEHQIISHITLRRKIPSLKGVFGWRI